MVDVGAEGGGKPSTTSSRAPWGVRSPSGHPVGCAAAMAWSWLDRFRGGTLDCSSVGLCLIATRRAVSAPGRPLCGRPGVHVSLPITWASHRGLDSYSGLISGYSVDWCILEERDRPPSLNVIKWLVCDGMDGRTAKVKSLT